MPPDPALAYIFWHWRKPDVPVGEYEAHQRSFHARLAASPPHGFSGSTSSALTGAFWANNGTEAYQDRYHLRDAGALDALDNGVAAGAQRRTHEQVVQVAADGVGGLYRVRLGVPLDTPRFALWFGKPRDLSYDRFLEQCAPVVERGTSVLWMRRMALGPTTEFCLESTEPVTLPLPIPVLALTLRPVWPA